LFCGPQFALKYFKKPVQAVREHAGTVTGRPVVFLVFLIDMPARIGFSNYRGGCHKLMNDFLSIWFCFIQGFARLS